MFRPLIVTTLSLLLLAFCQKKEQRTHSSSDTLNSIASLKQRVAQAIRDLNFDKANLILDSFRLTITSRQDLEYFHWNKFKGQVSIYTKHMDSAHRYLSEALRVAKGDSLLTAAAKNQLSIYFTGIKQYDTALIFGKEAYELSSKDSSEKLIACMNLAVVYQAIGNTEKQRYYLFEGISYVTLPQQYTMYANEIALYYERNNNLDSAIYFYKEVANFHAFSNTIVSIYKHQSLGRLYLKYGDTLSALTSFKKSLASSSLMGNINAQIYLTVGKIHLLAEGYKKARPYIDTAILGFKSKDQYWGVVECYNELANYESSKGKFKQAADFKDSVIIFAQVNDSISKSQQLHRVESKYELKIKQDHIALLQTINESKDKLNKQQSIIIMSLFIVLLLLIIIGLLLARKKLLKMQMHELEIQQEFLTNIMQPHFLFSSLTILQNIIRIDAKRKALDFLSKMAKLMRLIFSNSGKKLIELEQELLTLETFLEINKELYENKFTYLIKTYENYHLDDIMIPPLLLQPFVENAIIHGMKNAENIGHILVEVRKTLGFIEYVIEDNGNGFGNEKQRLKEMHSTEVARQRLVILSKRMKQLSSLEIIDKSTVNIGTGVKVIIKIPLPI